MILDQLTRLGEWGARVRRKPLNVKQVEYPGKGFVKQVRIRIDTRDVPKGLKVNVNRTLAELRNNAGQTGQANAPFMEWLDVGPNEKRVTIYFHRQDPAAEQIEKAIPTIQTPNLSVRGWLEALRKSGIRVEQMHDGQTDNKTIKIQIPTKELDVEKQARLDVWIEKLHEHVRDQNEDEIPKNTIGVEHIRTPQGHHMTFTVPNHVTAGAIRSFFQSGPLH